MHAGRHDLAHRLGTEGLDLFTTLKNTGKIADALRLLGTNAQVSGEYDLATLYLEEALALSRERGAENTAGQLLAHLATSPWSPETCPEPAHSARSHSTRPAGTPTSGPSRWR
jgi:hypothetical protein